MLNAAIGCTDEIEGEVVPDLSKAIGTGQYEWNKSRPEHCSLELEISTESGYQFEHLLRCNDSQSIRVNLRDAILTGKIGEVGPITIKCGSCEVSGVNGSDEQSKPKEQSPVTFKLDMAEAKKAELGRLEAERLAEAAAEAERRREENQRRLAEIKEQKEKKDRLARELEEKRERQAREQERARKKSVNDQLLGL